MRIRTLSLISMLALGVTAGSAYAKIGQDEVAKLSGELTPFGAVRAANADGSIPAWEGGIAAPPAGWKEGEKLVHPYKDEKPLFSITKDNLSQYADKLSEGHKELFNIYPDYRMDVYPSQRSASYPQAVYDGTAKTALTAELTEDGNGVKNAVGGIPFPIPQNGNEAVWNVILRPLLSFTAREWSAAPVTQSGKYTLTKAKDWATVVYWAPDIEEDAVENILWKYKKQITAPPRTAGQILLLHETINQTEDARKAWVYNPGQRRVRRAPEFAFDNPWDGSDGLMTIDENIGFNGSPERYSWKLVGKREMYIPYNCYNLVDGSVTYEELLKPGYPNPAAMRYELHRVWVVEANLKEGARHIYKKRVLYVDEDTWTPLVMDHYDNRGNLWRMGEVANINYYYIPFVNYGSEFHYDLQSGRYVGNFLNPEEPAWQYHKELGDNKDFTTQALRRSGRR